MATRTEQQLAVGRAERRAVRISCEGIGRGLLLGEGDIELNAVLRLELLQIVGYMLAEQRQMVVRHGEVDVHLAVGCSVHRTLHHVLQCRRACTVTVRVEKQQALRQIAVVHVLQEEAHCVLTLLACQLLAKGKLGDIVEELTDERSLNAVVEVLEQVLEHTRSGSRCRNELQHLMSLSQILLPGGNQLLALSHRRTDNALVQRGRLNDIQHRKTRLETFELLLRLLYGNTTSTQLLEVLLGKVHGCISLIG